ncbi:MAG: RNA 2',3'-cyclic phosphodiesterase [Candidatus Lokiarchaeota archaeon]|nr:RNA 2',3'-cyclic phosphodiesterase [Candidatus Lokiarchaeota archaeon]
MTSIVFGEQKLMDNKLRSFISVNISNETLLERIMDIQNALDYTAAKIKKIKPENIHFTLRFLGNTSESKLALIKKELEKASFNPFRIIIEGVGVFPKVNKPRIIWVGVTHNAPQFVELKEQIDNGLKNLGYDKDRKFIPHATIARVRYIKKKELLKQNITHLSERMIGEMEIYQFSMMISTLTPDGPIYKKLWSISSS